MFGYIYKTTNLINKKIYIGKHVGCFDESYKGSGKILRYAIEKYGIDNFKTEMIFKCESLEELNEKEKEFIKYYKQKYKRNCYNIASGGDGGDVYYYNEYEKKLFIEKMKIVNKVRCNTLDFKKKASKNMKLRYENPKERIKQSEKVRKAWEDEELRKKQSEIVKETWKKRNGQPKLKKPLFLEFNEEKIFFESRKDLEIYLKDKYNLSIYRPTLTKMIHERIPFETNSKKLQKFAGMKVYRCDKDVETKGDECSPVG